MRWVLSDLSKYEPKGWNVQFRPSVPHAKKTAQEDAYNLDQRVSEVLKAISNNSQLVLSSAIPEPKIAITVMVSRKKPDEVKPDNRAHNLISQDKWQIGVQVQ